MPLSWNEIRNRAFTFVKEWQDETSEHAEAKSFWDDFFNVFGISRRRVASFEKHVKKMVSYLVYLIFDLAQGIVKINIGAEFDINQRFAFGTYRLDRFEAVQSYYFFQFQW